MEEMARCLEAGDGLIYREGRRLKMGSKLENAEVMVGLLEI